MIFIQWFATDSISMYAPLSFYQWANFKPVCLAFAFVEQKPPPAAVRGMKLRI